MGSITTDIWTGLAFCTRLPLTLGSSASGNGLARAVWTFPLVGVLVGVLAACVYWIAAGFDLLPFVSATLAITAALLFTGALHEDGLADTVDGFGGRTRERKLEIMRDSRTGTYGVAALVLSFMLRAGALASLVEPGLVAVALIAAHAGGRATMPVLMLVLPQARQDGLAADAGEPPLGSVIVATCSTAESLRFCEAIAWLDRAKGAAVATPGASRNAVATSERAMAKRMIQLPGVKSIETLVMRKLAASRFRPVSAVLSFQSP